MKQKTFQGKTVEQAIEQAKASLANLELLPNQITVVQEAKKGFLGLGGQPAIIKVDIPESEKFTEEKSEPTEKVSPSTEKEPESFEKAIKEEEEPTKVTQEELSHSEEKAINSEPSRPQFSHFDEDAASIFDPKPIRRRGVRREVTVEVPYDDLLENGFDFDEFEEINSKRFKKWNIETIAYYIKGVLSAYLVESTIEVEDLEDTIIYHIVADKPGLVIGKHGKIINALEALAQSLMHRYVKKHVDVVVDVGDYRVRRQKILEKLAERTADQVTMDHKSVSLNALPARERKIIHRCLAQYSHIETHSQGREPHRHLVVSYKE
ncbi:RNA-binding cell elongation regulator Jag/EloR [Aerococcus christensenii]|uniref:RNA-binding cell elongation regulator Jag/EloR n=1 Tax=Aerococcus christensenii TaxID=87541 RepID=UPI00076328E5|nr:RNA-binding cell elongation regulator Jag/EloR [Aerococcus christensenii]AMB92380.1 hypothetical protein AWM71_03190 [Aerococcus christensenii]